jgi:dolichyl-phosphate beta-glucosyltransferase
MPRPVWGDAPHLTVIVPAFNESTRLVDSAARVLEASGEGFLNPETTELIVVDDGSTDDTGWQAERLLSATFRRLRVLRLHDNAGKGAAVRLGISATSAPVVLFMDADMSVEPAEIPRLVKAIGPADIAIGSRSLEDSVVAEVGLRRKVMGRTFNAFTRTLTHLPFRDTQCGFKAFRTPVARTLFHFMRVERFAFDVEILCLARQLRMDVAEVAVVCRETGASTVRPLADPLSMTHDLIGARRRPQPPNLPALAVTAAPDERRRSRSRIVTELHGALGPNFPLLFPSRDESLVLLPLCAPVEVQDIAARLRRLPTKLSVRERSVSFAQLTRLVPFQWVDGDSDGFIVAPRTGVENLCTRRPVEGWDSMRRLPAQRSHLYG